MVLVLLSLGAAVARDALANHVRRLLPFINRLGGAALVLAGIYLLIYWIPALSGGQAGGILSSAITAASVSLSGFITDYWLFITVAVVLAVLAAATLSWLRRDKAKTRGTDERKQGDGIAQADNNPAYENNDAESCCRPDPATPDSVKHFEQGTS